MENVETAALSLQAHAEQPYACDIVRARNVGLLLFLPELALEPDIAGQQVAQAGRCDVAVIPARASAPAVTGRLLAFPHRGWRRARERAGKDRAAVQEGGRGRSGRGFRTAPAGGPPAPDDLIALRGQIEQERQRAEANYANWQRATADFINYKRRTEQEREEAARYANTALILNVLPAVDDLERALQHVDPGLEEGPWIDGVRQIVRKLKGALAAAGFVERCDHGWRLRRSEESYAGSSI